MKKCDSVSPILQNFMTNRFCAQGAPQKHCTLFEGVENVEREKQKQKQQQYC
jgi:hypothetical protein